jgi:hypothetical protein
MYGFQESGRKSIKISAALATTIQSRSFQSFPLAATSHLLIASELFMPESLCVKISVFYASRFIKIFEKWVIHVDHQ